MRFSLVLGNNHLVTRASNKVSSFPLKKNSASRKLSKMGTVKSVGPNEAIVLSGTLTQGTVKKVMTGGWLWKSVASTNYMKISLSLITVYPKCNEAETSEGVQVSVSGAAHVKVKRELVRIAAEQWGGKKREEIRAAMEATIGGHLRSILSSLTVEEAYKDRQKFAETVREEAETDLARMGFTIMSFVILDIQDNVGYLSSLGKRIIANVKRDAAIAEAEANRDASVREFECQTATQEAQLMTEEKIEANRRDFELANYGYKREMETAKAEVEWAYTLSAARLMHEIMWNDKECEVIERRKRVEIESVEIQRRTLELETNQKLPAVAESYRNVTIAEGMKNAKMLLDKGKREGQKIAGVARQKAIHLVADAHVQEQRLRAEVFKKHGTTAVASQVLDALPKIAAAISLPLSTIEEIIMIDEDTLTAMALAHEALNSENPVNHV